MPRGRPPGSNNKGPPLSVSDMLTRISEAVDKQSKEPNLYGYKPYEKQGLFHDSQKFGRLFIGGNQSGKTTSGVVEDLRWTTKRHPSRRIPSGMEIHGRVIGVDFFKGVDKILIPEFKRWVLPSDLKNGSWLDSWDEYRHTLTFADGSDIEFMSYEQSLEKFAGTKRHFIHFDEEPPESIFGENMARLLAQEPAAWWITMTPIEGITWISDRFMEVQPDDVDVFLVDSNENIYLPEGSISRTFSNLDIDEQKVRTQGAFIPKGGRVFPEFQQNIHAMVPAGWLPPKDWTVWTSQDVGWNNPTCILYTAVSPNQEDIVTFHEMYGNGRIVSDWANEMLEYERLHGLSIYVRVGDPAMKQHNMVTGTSVQFEFARHGIDLALDSIPKDTGIGVNKIKQYMRPNPRRSFKPFWQIVGASCPNLVTQMKKLEWEHIRSGKLRDQKNRPEVIKKKDDHAPDTIRYQFTCFPDLTDRQLNEKYDDDKFVDNNYLQTLVNMAAVGGSGLYAPPKRPKSAWKSEFNSEYSYEELY